MTKPLLAYLLILHTFDLCGLPEEITALPLPVGLTLLCFL